MDPAKQPKKVGPIIAVFLVIVILVIAAIYLFASKSNKDQNLPKDDIHSIQADLNSSATGIDSQNF